MQLGLGVSAAVCQGGCQGWSLNVDEGKGTTKRDLCTLSSQRRDPERQCARAVAGLSLPALGFPVGLSLGVRSEVIDELPADLIGGLPELMVLQGQEGGVRGRHGQDKPEPLPFCPGCSLAYSHERLPAGS